MAVARAHLFIHGRVQGVFYRATCEEQARGLSLSGWVSNLPDGRVEVVTEGEQADVQNLISWSRKGPVDSKVTNVEVRWEEPAGETGGFRIR